MALAASAENVAANENQPLPMTLEAQKESFQKFMRDHEKAYSSKKEEESRFSTFRENLAVIHRRRSQFKNAVFNINKYADLSESEFRKMRSKPYKADVLAKSCLAHGVTREEEVNRLRALKEPPAEFSWKSKGVVTPVKNQGACGSCWTFSTTGAIESANAIKTGKLISLSEQEIVDCSHACTEEPPYGKVCNDGCGGGWPWGAMTDLKAWKGSATEAEYPYLGVTSTCKRNSSMHTAPISNYTCLSGTVASDNGPANEKDMVNYCFAHGPLSIAMDASPLQFYFGGVVDPWDSWDCSSTSLDHALLIVGWGTYDSYLWGEQPYWLIKNSWGADWGESGYFKLYRGSNMCGVAAAVTHPTMA